MRATVTARPEPGRPGDAGPSVAAPDGAGSDGAGSEGAAPEGAGSEGAGSSGPGRPDPRWVLARERTLLAWLRLSLALFLLGLAPVALVPPGVARLPVTVVGVALMLGCMAAAVVGIRRWHAGPHPDPGGPGPTGPRPDGR